MTRLFAAAIVLACRSKPSAGSTTWKKPFVSTTSKPLVGGRGIGRRRGARRRDAKSLGRDDPPTGAKQRADALHGPRRLALVHQEEARVGEVECASERLALDVVDITDANLDVLEP